nr:hypothetical protein BaRGS_029839 [Batillaria attramentaria]
MAGPNLTSSQFDIGYNIHHPDNASNTIISGHGYHHHHHPAANLSDPQDLHLSASVAVANTAAAATLTSDLYDDQGAIEMSTMFGPLMSGPGNGTLFKGFDKNRTVMINCVMFGSGVLGNLLALYVLATSSVDQRRSVFYKLVAGLAVTDLLGTIATSPVVIAVYMNNLQWVGGTPLCHYFSFAMIFAGYATMLIVCTMSVERYICVRHPYIYHTRLSGKFAKLALLGCWTVSIAIASLPLIGVGTNVKQFPYTWCFFDYLSTEPADVAFNYIYAVIALLVVIVTFVCNVSVIVTLLTLRSRQNRLDASEAPVGGAPEPPARGLLRSR